jgi:hypothetical protein
LKPIKTAFPLLLITIWVVLCSGSPGFASVLPLHYLSADSITQIKTDSVSLDSIITPGKKGSAIKSKIVYKAKDSIVYDITGTQVFLYNGAEVYYEKITLKADFIRIDQKNKVVYAHGVPDSLGVIKGKPVFTDNGQVYNSDDMSYNFETKKGKIKQVTTQQGEGYLLADDVKKNQYDEVFIKDGKYTTCNLPHPHFYIALTKAKNTSNKTISGPAYLVVEDVPLPLALPFGFFPRKSGRSSGILLPEVGEDRALGFFMRNGGYYFGVSDHLDLALRGDIYSKGSYGFNTLARYNTRYRYNGNVYASYSDRRFGEPETVDFTQTKDFSLNWMHTQDTKARPGTRFNANVNIASRNNFRNSRTPSIQSIVQNNLASSISYSKTWAGTPFSFNSSLSHNQNLQTGVVSISLPKATFSIARINPLDKKNRVGAQKWYQKIGFNYNLDLENRITTYDSLLFRQESIRKFDNGIRHTLPVSTSFNILKFINVSPSLNYNERWYFSTIEKSWNGTSVVTDTLRGFRTARDYGFSTSMTTRVYGMFNVNRLGILKVRHVLTPTLNYSYRPDFASARYGYYKNVQVDTFGTVRPYSIFEQNTFGGPPAGRSSSVGFGLGNNIEMKVRTKNDSAASSRNVKIFDNVSVNSAYNFAADSLQLAPISLVAYTTLFDKISVNFNASYDPYVLRRDTLGRAVRVNEYEWDVNQRIGRLTSASLSLGTNLNPDAFRNKARQNDRTVLRDKYSQRDLDYIDQNAMNYVDWTIPWSLSVNYILSYSRPEYQSTTTQSLNFNGDLSVTPKWKIGFTSGYDFKLMEITPTSLNIYRDLHCWDLAINWIPFGTYQRYSVDLKVKASILQDLKLSRRREYYERF